MNPQLPLPNLKNVSYRHLLSLLAISLTPARALPLLYINEIDADQPGTDTAEFIELYTPEGARSLAGVTLVLYSGSGSGSHTALDLSASTTNPAGYLLIGPPGMIPPPDLIAPTATTWLRNGPDAVALYASPTSAFPPGTPATTANLLDALIYTAGSPPGTITGLGNAPTRAEATGTVNTALARRANGQCAWVSQPRTPRTSNGSALTYHDWTASYPSLGLDSADPDLDGSTNAQEFLFGTHPNNCASAPNLTVASDVMTFSYRQLPPRSLPRPHHLEPRPRHPHRSHSPQ